MKRLALLFVFVLLIVIAVSCNTQEPENDLSEQIGKDLDKALETIKDLNENMDKDKGIIKELQEDTDKLIEDVKEKELIINENGITIQELEDNKMVLEEKVSELEEAMEEAESGEMMLAGPTPGASLLMEASNVVYLMSINDYANLSLYVDPTDGVRVSPYQFVDTVNDIVLTVADMAGIATYPMTNWGTYDGSGDPINLTGIDYYNQFIYNADFNTAPYIGQNVVITSGNMINNITTVYPGASFVEFHFDGFNPLYEGLDWTSLTVVMKNVGGQWYLIGLVHGQWTI